MIGGTVNLRAIRAARYRASGLTLVTAAIAFWNTVYIESIPCLRAERNGSREGA